MTSDAFSAASSASSRRAFLRRAGAAAMGMAAALALPGVSRAAGEELEVHVFSKHLQWLGYDDMAATAARLGFDGVDLTVRPGGHVEPSRVREDLPRAVAAVRRHGLKAELMTTAVTDAADPLAQDVLRTAAEQGIRQYRLGYYHYPDDGALPDHLAHFREQVEALASLNEELGLTGAYQNHAGTLVGASMWEVHALLRDRDPRWMGAQYDIRHAVVEGGHSWPLGLRLVRPHVVNIVAKDMRWAEEGEGWEVVNTPIGKGMVDFGEYFGLLKDYGLHVPVSMHYEYDLGGAEHGDRTLEVPEDEVLHAMTRDLNTLRQLWQDA